MIGYVGIGNSDDKLSQASWSAFVAMVNSAVVECADQDGGQVHFAGFSAPGAPWQNAAWIIQLPHNVAAVHYLKSRLQRLASVYRQDSIAWAQFDVDFLDPVDAP